MMLILAILHFLGTRAQANWVVELKGPANEQNQAVIRALPGVKKIETFLNVNDSYFERLVRIESDPALDSELKPLLAAQTLVQKVEPIISVELSSIDVAAGSHSLGTDPLSVYQWGLINQNQILHRDIDDIHDQPILGVSGKDIHWSRFISQYESKILRPIKVAVLDSGAALEHPDLKDILLPGWNFTTTDLKGDFKPYDDLGHGTHVAGIIAASANNGVGVRGVSGHLRVIPIKVLSAAEDPSNPGHPKMGLSDRVTQGILFAVNAGAEVINFSMGWPRSMDTSYLRKAVSFAQSKGVIFVAAAGNNSHDQTIFPCSYPGVVCVGAYSADGSYAPYSNYGGHIDVSAPGDQILSTYPTIMTPKLFRLKGYDILNGTSQAAPYVTATVAILRALYPNETTTQLRARLFQTAETDGKTQYGRAVLGEAIEANSASVLFPELKEMDSVLFNAKDGNFKQEIRFTALGDTQATNLNLSLADAQATLEQSQFSVPALKDGETFTLTFSGRLKDLKQAALSHLTISSFSGPRARSVTKSFFWTRDLTQEPTLRTLNFSSDVDPNTIGVVSEQNVYPLLKSLDSYYTPLSGAEYFYVKKDLPQIKISFFSSDGSSSVNNEKPIVLSDAIILSSLLKVDLNYDGIPDLLLTYLSKNTAGAEVLNLCYYNQAHEPLFKEACFHWTSDPKLIQVLGSNFAESLLHAGGYQFVPGKTSDGAKIALPLFYANGILPDADQNQDSWANDTQAFGRHAYQFSLSANQDLSLRAVDSFQFTQAFRNKFALSWKDDLNFVTPLTQTESMFRRGQAQILFNYGSNYVKKNVVMDVQSGEMKESDTGSFHPELFRLNPIFKISNQGFENSSGNNFSSFYTSTIALANHWNYSEGEQVQTYRYDHADPLDNLLSVSSSFDTPSANLTVYFSKNKMELSGKSRLDGHTFFDSSPVYRFSFLPGKLFSELYFPIEAEIGGEMRPALYLDRSQINAKQISVITVGNEKFEAFGLMNYSLPPLCQAMNPVPTEGRLHAFDLTLMCFENNKWILKQMPIQIQ